MRRFLIDRARRKLTARHGGGVEQVNGDDIETAVSIHNEPELTAMHEALALHDPHKAKPGKLRYFAGLSID